MNTTIYHINTNKHMHNKNIHACKHMHIHTSMHCTHNKQTYIQHFKSKLTHLCTLVAVLVSLAPMVSLLSPTGGNDVEVLSKSRILLTESLPRISAFVKSSFNPPSAFPCVNMLSLLKTLDTGSVFGTNSSDLVRYFGYFSLRFCVVGIVGNFEDVNLLMTALSNGPLVASDSLRAGISSNSDFLPLHSDPYICTRLNVHTCIYINLVQNITHFTYTA